MSTSTVPTSAHAAKNPGWLLSPVFDLSLIGLSAIIALQLGLAVLLNGSKEFLGTIIFFDLWLLGHHHVVSTFTRLCFDRKSFEEHRFLVVKLPFIVIGCVVFAVFGVGAWRMLYFSGAIGTIGEVFNSGKWVLTTTYLYWQWFHYTRQSYGVERMYRRNAPAGSLIYDGLTKYALYLLPLAGILYRSWKAQPTFVGLEVMYFPVHIYVVYAASAAAAVASILWLGAAVMAMVRGQLAVPHFMYVLSHHVIFLTGYILIDDITVGWLVLNVWHNIQYILFVWWANHKKFNDEIDPERPLISMLSRKKNFIIYMLVCIGIATLVFEGLHIIGSPTGDAVSWAMIVAMVLNFHHYVVDGVIWRRKKKPAATPAAPQPAAS